MKKIIKEIKDAEFGSDDIDLIGYLIEAGVDIEKAYNYVLNGSEMYDDPNNIKLFIDENKSNNMPYSKFEDEIKKRDITVIMDDLRNVSDTFDEDMYWKGMRYGNPNEEGMPFYIQELPSDVQKEIYTQIISICGEAYARLGKEVDDLPSIALTDNEFIISYLKQCFFERIKEFDKDDRYDADYEYDENDVVHEYDMVEVYGDDGEDYEYDLDENQYNSLQNIINFVEETLREVAQGQITPEGIEEATSSVKLGDFRSSTGQIKESATGEQEITTEGKNIDD